jgi:hypothetical protein
MGLSKNEGHDVQLVPETTRDDYPLAIAYRCVYFFLVWVVGVPNFDPYQFICFVLILRCSHSNYIKLFHGKHADVFILHLAMVPIIGLPILEMILDPNHNDKFVSYQPYV